ncbi:MAG: hypothetical protein QM817_32875 [Archangium sp.]
MARALPILSLCIALFALGMSFVSREPPAPVAPVAAANDSRLGDDVLELKKRVELLEDDSSKLWDRVVVLERRGVLSVDANDAGFDPTLLTEVIKLRDEVHALSAGPSSFANDAGRAALADLVKEVQAEQAKQRASDRMALRLQRATDAAARWKAFVTEAKLSSGQQRFLEERLLLEETSRKAIFERSDGTYPPPETLRAMTTQRRETDKMMRDQLDSTQWEAFQNLRREERGGGDRRGER